MIDCPSRRQVLHYTKQVTARAKLPIERDPTTFARLIDVTNKRPGLIRPAALWVVEQQPTTVRLYLVAIA